MPTQSVRVRLNKAAVIALLSGAETQGELGKRTGSIAAAAGPGFEAEVVQSGDRAVGFVRTETPEAREAEATQRVLTRAIDAGR